MPWSVGPIPEVASDRDAEEKLDDAFDKLGIEVSKADQAAFGKAKSAIKALVKSDAAGEAPFEISVAAHGAVRDSGSRPYISVSVVGSSPSGASSESG